MSAVEAVLVDGAELRRLWRLLGGIPGGSGAPVRTDGKTPDLEELLDALERDLEHLRGICERYEDDRQDLSDLRRDLAAVRRVLGTES